MEEKGMMGERKGVVQMNKIDWKALLKTQTGSILMIVLGAVLAIYPDSASVLASAVLGWVIIAVGVVILVGGFLGGPDIGSILQGAFFLVIGAWLHRNPLMIATLLGFTGYHPIRSVRYPLFPQTFRQQEQAVRK